ncbi:MAG: hypothetical protein AB1592_06375 [Pseudomonadota bacterium]
MNRYKGEQLDQIREIISNDRSRQFALILISIVFFCSSLLWVFRDQSVWPWDQAYYGEVSLDLAYAFSQGLAVWFRSMISAIGFKPPLLVWIAQAAVPFSDLVGGVERAFLLVNIFISGSALFLLYRLGRKIGGSEVQSFAGVLLCGGSSLFIGITHQFFVEPLQALAIVGLMHTSLRCDIISIIRLFGELLFYISMSFLIKSSSIGYVLPFIAYIVIVRFSKKNNPCRKYSYSDYLVLTLGILAALAASAWYFVNWAGVLRHALLATVGPEAVLWGEQGAFSKKFMFWIEALNHALFPWSALGVAFAALLLLAIGAAFISVVKAEPQQWFLAAIENRLLYALMLLGTAATAIIVHALQINQETRFLMPMLPLVSLTLVWALHFLNRPAINFVAFIVGALDAGASISGAHGMAWPGAVMSVWLKPYQENSAAAEKLMKAIILTCDGKHANRYNIVGVDMPFLNANSAEFYATKNRRHSGYKCFYTSLGFAEVNASAAFSRIDIMNAPYVITLLPTALTADTDAFNKTAYFVSERLSKDPKFAPLAVLDDIVIFKKGEEPQ